MAANDNTGNSNCRRGSASDNSAQDRDFSLSLAGKSSCRLTAPLNGDANLDGTVNINDLSTVLTNYDKADANWTTGDFDGDGTANISDLSVVLTNYDTSSSAASIRAVPEPSSLLLVAIGLVAFVWWRRK
jgi:hypothetical protein